MQFLTMKKERKLYKYYLFLMVILCTWTSTVAAPPTPVRLLFLTALIVPILFNNTQLLIPVLACFSAVASYGFSCSYMPTELYYYLGILSVLFLLNIKKISHTQRPPAILVLCCFYFIFFNLI